jgi:hypothetical protein
MSTEHMRRDARRKVFDQEKIRDTPITREDDYYLDHQIHKLNMEFQLL